MRVLILVLVAINLWGVGVSNAWALGNSSIVSSEDIEGELYSHFLVMALIGASDNLELHEKVGMDFSNKKLRENIREMVAHIEEKNRSCQRELKVLKKLHAEDLGAGYDDRIPIASIQDFDTLGGISERLSDVFDRTRDMRSFIDMRDAFTSHFDVYHTTLADRNMCREEFAIAYKGGIDNPKLQKACTSFDELRSCVIEARRIDLKSEKRRAVVSEKYFDGRLKPRESRYPPKYKRQ